MGISAFSGQNKVTKMCPKYLLKVSKCTKIRNRYIQVPHLTQDTNGKVTNSQLYTTNESQEVSPFPAGDHKAQINRRAQRHNKHKTEKNIKDPPKKYSFGTVSKIFIINQKLINRSGEIKQYTKLSSLYRVYEYEYGRYSVYYTVNLCGARSNLVA